MSRDRARIEAIIAREVVDDARTMRSALRVAEHVLAVRPTTQLVDLMNVLDNVDITFKDGEEYSNELSRIGSGGFACLCQYLADEWDTAAWVRWKIAVSDATGATRDHEVAAILAVLASWDDVCEVRAS